MDNDEDNTVKKQTKYIQAPFLSLTGIPNLAIEDVNIAFELEVKTATEDKNKTDSTVQNETNLGFKSWWSPVTATTKITASVTHSSEQTRHTDTRAKYSFSIRARKQSTPETFMRIIDAITNSVTKPTEQILPDNLKEVGHGFEQQSSIAAG